VPSSENPAQYRDRWQLNTELADDCAASMPKGADWEIVFRFYALVHLVEGYLRTKERKFWAESHVERAQRFRDAPEIGRARGPYRNLEDLSKQVRYDPGYQPGASDFTNAKAWAKSVENVVARKLETELARLSPASGPSR
jgi:hypothetical protein